MHVPAFLSQRPTDLKQNLPICEGIMSINRFPFLWSLFLLQSLFVNTVFLYVCFCCSSFMLYFGSNLPLMPLSIIFMIMSACHPYWKWNQLGAKWGRRSSRPFYLYSLPGLVLWRTKPHHHDNNTVLKKQCLLHILRIHSRVLIVCFLADNILL